MGLMLGNMETQLTKHTNHETHQYICIMNKTITIHIFHANIVIIRADTLTVLFKTYTLLMCIVVSLLYSKCALICISDI